MSIKSRLNKREQLIQKTINIDSDLYERLANLSRYKYEESISRIINACIYELAQTENIFIYNVKNTLFVKHTIIFKKSALKELNRLKNKYNISICKLVNIAINNVIDELEQKS